MKKSFLILLIAIISACSGDDEGNQSPRLSGDWMLISADCQCAFDETINLQDFKLRFDDSGNTLHLDNPTESYYYIAETGAYKYDLEGDILKISGLNNTFKFKTEGNKLVLTLIDDPQIADDELVLTYLKNVKDAF